MTGTPPPEGGPCPARRVMWSVSVFRRSGGAEVHEYTSHRLECPDLTREHMNLARERPWVSRVELTEHVREERCRIVSERDLPAAGRPAPHLSAGPGCRVAAHFYEIDGRRPGGMLDADEARSHLDRMRHTSVGTALREVTVVELSRAATEEDLPST
ncbi:hypothetical protein [Streptomyces sp. CAU 1734]|uniref:hypothetical protein n=1 Tax=Streptomyces sp. CAU 1734 TaxID=3140360 RepID=UPI00325FE99A